MDMGTLSPCCGCDHRAEACHGHCEAYREWSQRRQEIAEKRRQVKRVEGFTLEQGARWRKRPDSRIKRGKYGTG